MPEDSDPDFEDPDINKKSSQTRTQQEESNGVRQLNSFQLFKHYAPSLFLLDL